MRFRPEAGRQPPRASVGRRRHVQVEPILVIRHAGSVRGKDDAGTVGIDVPVVDAGIAPEQRAPDRTVQRRELKLQLRSRRALDHRVGGTGLPRRFHERDDPAPVRHPAEAPDRIRLREFPGGTAGNGHGPDLAAAPVHRKERHGGSVGRERRRPGSFRSRNENDRFPGAARFRDPDLRHRPPGCRVRPADRERHLRTVRRERHVARGPQAQNFGEVDRRAGNRGREDRERRRQEQRHHALTRNHPPRDPSPSPAPPAR